MSVCTYVRCKKSITHTVIATRRTYCGLHIHGRKEPVLCKFMGCDRVRHSRKYGLCKLHYARSVRQGTRKDNTIKRSVGAYSITEHITTKGNSYFICDKHRFRSKSIASKTIKASWGREPLLWCTPCREERRAKQVDIEKMELCEAPSWSKPRCGSSAYYQEIISHKFVCGTHARSSGLEVRKLEKPLLKKS